MVVRISKHLNYERYTKFASDREVEAQNCCKVTLEYRLCWESRMYSTRSSKQQRGGGRANGKRSGWDSAVLRGHWKDKRAAAAFTDDDDGDDDEGKDLLELIDGEMPAGVSAGGGGGGGDGAPESPTKDRNPSPDTSHCSLDSGGSGPSSPQVAPGVGRSYAPAGLCPRCQKVWERARLAKRPLKNKLLDRDPSSLTCDEWVLKKRWRPRGLRVLESKLEGCLKLIRRRRSDVCGATRGQLACSRAHAFLQRNLRSRTKARRGRKRKNTRRTMTKRARGNPRQVTPSHTRQQRHLPTASRSRGDGDLQSPGPLSGGSVVESPPESGSEKSDDAAPQSPARITLEVVPSMVTLEVAPSMVTMETTTKQEAGSRREGPAKRAGFKELLAQLRGNGCAIVREDRQ